MGIESIALIALLLAGYGDDRSTVHRQGEPDVVIFDDADAEMDAAIEAARASFPGLVAKLPDLVAEGAYVSIKVPISTGKDRTEHVWLESPEIRDGVVTGALGNTPLGGSLKIGDPVSVPVKEISDWMAIVDDELFGGYTVLVSLDRMSQAERDAFDSTAGFRVPESARPF